MADEYPKMLYTKVEPASDLGAQAHPRFNIWSIIVNDATERDALGSDWSETFSDDAQANKAEQNATEVERTVTYQRSGDIGLRPIEVTTDKVRENPAVETKIIE